MPQPSEAPTVDLGTRVEALGASVASDRLEEARLLLAEITRDFDEEWVPASNEELQLLTELGAVAARLRSLEPQLAIWTHVVRGREARGPEDDPDLLDARHALAVTRAMLGDLPGALALQESVLASRARINPPDHPRLLGARMNLAVTRRRLGDLTGARSELETVIEVMEDVYPDDHRSLLGARQNLAITRAELGDPAGALVLFESILATRERTLAEDDHHLSTARQNVAVTKKRLGDLQGALALEERVLETRERTLPEDHPDLLAARKNLASTKRLLGDLEGSLELDRAVLAARERLLPETHPQLLGARQNVALSLAEAGDPEGALPLLESVLGIREVALPEGHPDLLRARKNVAVTLEELGERRRALAIFESVLEARERLLPEDHVDLLRSRQDLALARAGSGDAEGAASLLPAQISGLVRRHVEALSVAPREARALALSEARRVDHVLSLSGSGPHLPEVFGLIETRRHAATAPAVGPAPESFSSLRGGLAQQRSRLNDLVLGGPSGGEDLTGWRRRVQEASLERDAVLSRLRASARSATGFVDEIDAATVAAALPPASLAAGYLRYQRWQSDTATSADALLALVVTPSGTVERVELGAADELEELARQWRASVNVPVGDTRGEPIPSAPASPGDSVALGQELRRRLVDPLLSTAPDVETAFVCLDDFLHLVPLDALPSEAGEAVVGDRCRIRTEVSFARLSAGAADPPPEGGLVILGDVDYDAGSAEVTTGASFGPWRQLPATRGELSAIVDQFERVQETDPVELSGAAATKDALEAAVVGARFVHLATHGWFAAEAVLSSLDAHEGVSRSRESAERTVVGLAPMTLCGLCLTGANAGRDSLGRTPGLLSAEELAGFDLSSCELAVLSACETNVGIRRAGQGIQSLQAALHAAGARAAVTSLWRVDDAATRRLMELFYTRLWRDELGKADALWQAKVALREEGHPVSDWAGWVLTGNPD